VPSWLGVVVVGVVVVVVVRVSQVSSSRTTHWCHDVTTTTGQAIARLLGSPMLVVQDACDRWVGYTGPGIVVRRSSCPGCWCSVPYLVSDLVRTWVRLNKAIAFGSIENGECKEHLVGSE
jgi:hypothetical protein